MMKFLVIVAIFAIPVISQETIESIGFPETLDKIVCKNVTAVVLEKQETFYQEFVKCVGNTVDIKQMNQDLRFMLRTLITSIKFNPTLSDVQIASMRLYTQSYCPKLKTLFTCEDAYSSIYSDCLPAVEAQAKKIKMDTMHRIVEFFCENNADEMMNFINGKFFQCVMPRQFEMRMCLRTFFTTMKMFAPNVPLMTNAYCKSMDDFFTCTTTILQQCELSQTPAKLMESLRLYMQKQGICSTVGDAMKLRMSLM